MKRVLASFGILSLVLALSACSEDLVEEVTPFSVTYVDEDGTLIVSYEVMPGEKAPVPEDPFKEGYTFESWNNVAQNVNSDIEIRATYTLIERIIEPTILVLTYLEGIEPTLNHFFDIPVEIVRSLEGLNLSDYVRVLVLYEDVLRSELHPSRIGAPTVLEDQFTTFKDNQGVELTVVYLKDVAAFETFFEILDETLFDLEGIQITYAFYPLEGITVYDSSSQFDVQRLVDLFDGAAIARRGEDLKWWTTSQAIYMFLGTTIPSFLSSYTDQIRPLDNQITEIITERGQRLIIGRSTSVDASEYYDSFLRLVTSGIEGTMRIPGYRPERLSTPQTRIAPPEMCYTEELRGLKYPTNLPHEVTLSHDIPLRRVKSTGKIVALNVRISFNEYPSTISDEAFRSYILEATKTSDAFFDEMSNGQLTFEWIHLEDVVYVPFFLDPSMTPDNPNYESRINEHIALVTSIVEETIDLTEVEIINFYWAPGIPDYVYGGLSALIYERMDTQRGNIYNYNVKKFEMRYIDDPIVFARNIYHGMAHNLGLSDIYIQQWVPEFMGKPPNYKYGNWDIMTSAINELNAWHRWILSWIDDDQVHCIPPTEDAEYEVFLEPLNEDEGETRIIVIPLSETETIYIELRGPGTFCPEERWRSYSYPWLQGGCTQNVLVTHLNTMKGNGHGPKQILRPARSNEEDYSDALLLTGEFVTFNNITITHSERYGSGSVITIRFNN